MPEYEPEYEPVDVYWLVRDPERWLYLWPSGVAGDVETWGRMAGARRFRGQGEAVRAARATGRATHVVCMRARESGVVEVGRE